MYDFSNFPVRSGDVDDWNARLKENRKWKYGAGDVF